MFHLAFEASSQFAVMPVMGRGADPVTHVIDSRSMNWLDPPAEPPTASSSSDPDSSVPPQDPQSPSISNLNYWAARLTPLHDPAPGYGEALAGTGVMDAPPPAHATVSGSTLPPDFNTVHQPGGDSRLGADDTAGQKYGERRAPEEVVFVACNRVGTELGTCCRHSLSDIANSETKGRISADGDGSQDFFALIRQSWSGS